MAEAAGRFIELAELRGAEKFDDLPGLPRILGETELVSVHLNRDSPSVVLTLLFSAHRVPELTGRYYEMVLAFSEIENFHLENFNHQNVVSGISIIETFEPRQYSSEIVRRLHIDVDTVFGAWSTFTCAEAEILSLLQASSKDKQP